MDVNPQKTTIGCLGPLPLHKVYAFDQCVPGLHCRHPTQSQPQTKRLGFDPVIYGISSQKRQSFDEIKPGMLANVGVLKQSQLALHLEKSKLHVWTPDRLGLPGIPVLKRRHLRFNFLPSLSRTWSNRSRHPRRSKPLHGRWQCRGRTIYTPLKSQSRNKINEGAIFQPRIFKSRFEVKCPFSGCPLSSHVLSSNAGCDWHCRYREWQNFGVSVASFQLLGRLFLPWNPILDR